MDIQSLNNDYLMKLLDYLDKLLYTAFWLKKEKDGENLPMRGLVITEKEVERAFDLIYEEMELEEEIQGLFVELEEEIREMESDWGEALYFNYLCVMFDLSRLECLALLLCAAPIFNRKYEKIYGYLQDHVDIPEPTKGLCVSLAELIGKEEDSDLFLSGSGNLHFLIDTNGEESSALGTACRLKVCVREFLYGMQDQLSGSMKSYGELFTPYEELQPMIIRQDALDQLKNLINRLLIEIQTESDRGCMIHIYGKKGIGKHFLMKHLAAELESTLLFFDVSKLMYEKDDTIRRYLELLFTEAILCRAYIVLTGTDLDGYAKELPERRIDYREKILSWLGEKFPYFFVLSEEKEAHAEDFSGRTIAMELPALSAGERVQLWKSWSDFYPLEETIDLEQNGSKYILTPKGILDVLDTAKLLADMTGQERIGQELIGQAVKQNQKNQLGAFATLINSRFVWDDLILGTEQKRQMRMVCDQMRYRKIVGEQWGFHKKTPYGRGLSVLFYGPPGTGKTMAAQVMANELGLDLYRIDISQMVSKYIGETQKNISSLFEKAKDINAILFFDEADSLFAKRSEAKDSNDRNANAETAHLLQKLEDYEGIAILATNYLNNIDDAFKRRIKFIIHIAFPETEVRLKLWRSTLPVEAECEEELDFEFFAEQFELSGSSIKEILTNAAYLAASEGRGMKNCDLVEAVKLNFAKYGKILTDSHFGYLSV